MELLSATENVVFLYALVILISVFVIEILSLGSSQLIDSWLDVDVDGDIDTSPSLSSKVFTWLEVGKVPLLMLIVTYLTTFVVIGFSIQIVSNIMIGQYLSAPLAVLPALMLSVPVGKYMAKGVAAVFPYDNEVSLSRSDYVGFIGKVTTGVASSESSAEVYLDIKGTHKYIRGYASGNIKIPPGTKVKIIALEDEERYIIAPSN